jgi:hypothetical protein
MDPRFGKADSLLILQIKYRGLDKPHYRDLVGANGQLPQLPSLWQGVSGADRWHSERADGLSWVGSVLFMVRLQSENGRDYSVLGPRAFSHAEHFPGANGSASGNAFSPAGAIGGEPAGCQISNLARSGQGTARLLGSEHLGSASWRSTGEVTGTLTSGTQAASRRHGRHRCTFMRRLPGPVQDGRGVPASGRPALHKSDRA